MKIEYLKQLLQETGSSPIQKVYFDRRHIVNTEREKDYPYVFWNLDSFVSDLDWRNTSQQEEKVTITAFCIGYHDAEAQAVTLTREEVFDSLREAFRAYLSVLMLSEYLDVTNLSSMRNELYQIGITVDAEIGVSFTVTLRLFCNPSVPLPD
jgi:hypothetical protein